MDDTQYAQYVQNKAEEILKIPVTLALDIHLTYGSYPRLT